MNRVTFAGLKLILSGWAFFLLGLLSLLWLHTLRDRMAHAAIFPLCLLLWIVLLSCVWEGSKAVRKPVRRFLSFFAQVGVSVMMLVLFFLELINQWNQTQL